MGMCKCAWWWRRLDGHISACLHGPTLLFPPTNSTPQRHDNQQEATRLAAASAAVSASSGLPPPLSSLDVLQQQSAQAAATSSESPAVLLPGGNGSGGLRPPSQQQAEAAGSPAAKPQTPVEEQLEALSLGHSAVDNLPQPVPTTVPATPQLLPELPCTPQQGGFGNAMCGGRGEQVALMAGDAKVFTVHVGNTYSQADFHVESLLEVRRLLRDFASISFRQTSRTGGR